MQRNVKLILAYRGCSYLGWQETGCGPTIEGELQRAIERLLRHSVYLQAASRTDAGVHAEGQVVNFFTKSEISLSILFKGLNNLLPKEIRVVEVEEAAPNFHPTLDAVAKTYIYRLCNEPLPHLRHLAWHRPGLDLSRMREEASQLIGTRDFGSFCNRRPDLRYKSTVRTLYSIECQPHFITITGDNFLYKMARNLVSKLIGERMTAPAHGLSLARVHYSGYPHRADEA